MVAAAAVVLRTAYVLLARPAQDMPGLARKYLACAEHLLAGNGFSLQGPPAVVPYVDRVPGYVLLLAGLVAVVGAGAAALAVAHGVVAALVVPQLAKLATAVSLPRAGPLAALLWAAWPPFWRSDTQLLETGVAAVAVAGAAAALAEHVRRPERRSAWSLAAWCTLSLCLRAELLAVPFVSMALGACLLPRSRWTSLLPTLLLPLVVLVPWAARNARVADGPFLGVGFGTNLLAAIGESAQDEEPLFGDKDVAMSEGYHGLYWPDPKQRDRARVERALHLIGENPAAFARGAARRVGITLSLWPGDLWGGRASLREHVRAERQVAAGNGTSTSGDASTGSGASGATDGRYGGLARAVVAWSGEHPILAAATLAWGPALLTLAGVGAWRLRARPRALLLLLAFPALGVLLHVPLHAEPRYFFPFAPLLFVLGAAAFVGVERELPAS